MYVYVCDVRNNFLELLCYYSLCEWRSLNVSVSIVCGILLYCCTVVEVAECKCVYCLWDIVVLLYCCGGH
jgi:hypothetical protein